MLKITPLFLILIACAEPATSQHAANVSFGDTISETLPAGRTDDWAPQYCYGSIGVCPVYSDVSGSVLSGTSAYFSHGDVVFIKNMGPSTITLLHQSSFSMTANRFDLLDGHDVIIKPGRYYALTLIYGSSVLTTLESN